MYRLLVILFLFINCNSYAAYSDSTSSIAGQIFNEKRQPLTQAYIEVSQNHKMVANTTSDINGNYEISNINCGKYDVRVSHTLYKITTTNNVLLTPSKTTRVPVILQPVTQDDAVQKDYYPKVNLSNKGYKISGGKKH